MSLLDPTLSYKDFKNVDMVIEAVFEDIGIKHAVVKEVEQVRWKTVKWLWFCEVNKLYSSLANGVNNFSDGYW